MQAARVKAAPARQVDDGRQGSRHLLLYVHESRFYLDFLAREQKNPPGKTSFSVGWWK